LSSVDDVVDDAIEMPSTAGDDFVASPSKARVTDCDRVDDDEIFK